MASTTRQAPLVDDDGIRSSGIGKLVGQMLALSVPVFISRCSWVVMKVTDTAMLGHAGTRFIEAASLSDLWTQSTGVFIMSRASSTLSSQAMGAGQKKLVGIWMQVALAVYAPVCLVVALCWTMTGPILRALGKDQDLVNDAWYYALVLMLCLPVRIIFSQITAFFQSQKIMRPGAICATFAMVLNLLFGLPLVLGFPIPGFDGFGFKMCPWITTVLEYAQVFLIFGVYVYAFRMHEECWPGWSMKHITRDRVKVFLGQYLPSSLSLGSDFWRVAVIGIVADSLDDVNLVVWNASYRICWIMLTFLGSLASAMGILLGQSLGAGNARESRRIALVGTLVAFVLAGGLSLVVALFPRVMGSIFTSDPEVLDLFEYSRWPMAAFVLLMNMGTMMESIPASAGRMKTGFYAGIIGSWVGQVPGVFLCTKLWRNDLIGLYTGVAIGYGLLVVLLGGAIFSMNWDDVAAEARQRSEVQAKPHEDLATSLCTMDGDQKDGKGGKSASPRP